jgi:hypothetical protein
MDLYAGMVLALLTCSVGSGVQRNLPALRSARRLSRLYMQCW